jgi:hypothetical protein
MKRQKENARKARQAERLARKMTRAGEGGEGEGAPADADAVAADAAPVDAGADLSKPTP